MFCGYNWRMQQSEQDGIQVFRFESFPDNGVRHGIFGRTGGHSNGHFNALNMSLSVGDTLPNVSANWRKAYGLFDRDHDTLIHAHLIHDNTVTRVTTANHGDIMPQTDGLISNDPGVGLAMNFADCGSIFLYDPINHAIGLGHAGWKGAIADLPGAMVHSMVSEFGSDPLRLVAALGPCISVSRYEVDEPVISQVKERFPKWVDRLLVYRHDDSGTPIGRPHFNLALANHINLHDAGLPLDNVELPGLCTASRTDLFFSHRAERGKTGRFGSIFILDET